MSDNLNEKGTYALQVEAQTDAAHRRRRAEIIVSALLLAPAVLGLLVASLPDSRRGDRS